MRCTTIGLLILLLAAIGMPAPAEEWTHTFAVTARPQLRVETSDGSVTVRAADVKQIGARVSTVGWKINPSEVRVIDRQTADRVELEVRLPPRHHFDSFGFEYHYHSVTIELKVPRETRTEVHTADGRISVEGLRGEARLYTQDGRIEVEDMDGALEAKSSDGRIRVRGRLNVMNLHTSDGSIEAELSPGSRMASEWTVQSGDGHVTLRLPQGFAADLDARTGDGRITVDLPITVPGTISRSNVRGKMNGGGQTLRVRTGDGSIHLERL